MEPRKTELVSLLLFLLLVLGGGLAIGAATAPGPWYAALNKPSFNPPNWLFAPVWTALYVMIAVAGWRAWKSARTGAAMKLWWAQLALNFIWSPIFFAMQRADVALGVILLLLITIIGFIVTARRQDRVAALLFLPYAAWVAFASVLNGAIWLLN